VDEPHGLAWGDRRRCQVRIEPAFLCLDEEVQTRPFVGLSVPQILREVLGEALGKFAGRSLELRLQRPPGRPRRGPGLRRPRAVRAVRRIDLRLLPPPDGEEGLTHFFDHRGEVETLIVVDEAQFQRAGPPCRCSPASGPDGAGSRCPELSRVRTAAAPGGEAEAVRLPRSPRPLGRLGGGAADEDTGWSTTRGRA
jgi:uncharacterized protein involved in type VI secretion and phage assembly